MEKQARTQKLPIDARAEQAQAAIKAQVDYLVALVGKERAKAILEGLAKALG